MNRFFLTMLALFCSSIFFIGCNSGQKGEVTKDPRYADIANNIFFTKQPTYYYHYKQQRPDGKEGYFLSSQAQMPSAELIKEIPVRAHVHISKVFEIPQEDGSVQVMIEGKVFPDTQSSGEEYKALYEDIKPSLELEK